MPLISVEDQVGHFYTDRRILINYLINRSSTSMADMYPSCIPKHDIHVCADMFIHTVK